jgi:hypothetical protein
MLSKVMDKLVIVPDWGINAVSDILVRVSACFGTLSFIL